MVLWASIRYHQPVNSVGRSAKGPREDVTTMVRLGQCIVSTENMEIFEPRHESDSGISLRFPLLSLYPATRALAIKSTATRNRGGDGTNESAHWSRHETKPTKEKGASLFNSVWSLQENKKAEAWKLGGSGSTQRCRRHSSSTRSTPTWSRSASSRALSIPNPLKHAVLPGQLPAVGVPAPARARRQRPRLLHQPAAWPH